MQQILKTLCISALREFHKGLVAALAVEVRDGGTNSDGARALRESIGDCADEIQRIQSE